jgi:hypothetical protein
MMMQKMISFLALVLILFSCTNEPNVYVIPQNVAAVLDSAKINRGELEKVIQHYKELKDTNKLKAAYFLIGNMEGQSYSTTKIVDTAGNVVDFDVLSYPDYTTMVAAWDSVEAEIGSIDFARDTIVYDIDAITGDFLIENIDLAFDAWAKPWARFLNFDEFCEDILPYRASNEPLEHWRKQLYKMYDWVQDSIKDPDNPTEACILINTQIISWFDFDPLFYRHPTDLGLSEMREYKRGRCEDMTNLAIYAMRSQGVPVMSEYTPAWPNTGNNHAWNATLTKDRKVVIFMGGERNPYDYQLLNKKAKVYRKTFGRQVNSLAMIAPDYEKIPGWLASSHFIDVTSDYVPVTDVHYQLQKETPDSIHYAYLYVFNSGEWKEIHWGEIKDDSVVFTDMGRDIAYLPCYYKNGKYIPAGHSFILSEEGEIQENIADTIHTIDVDLYSTTRKVTRLTTDEIEKASFKDGAEYELYYWDDEWKLIASKKAVKDQPLRFVAIPSNALYWLIEKDSRKEERIFTIEDGQVNWW